MDLFTLMGKIALEGVDKAQADLSKASESAKKAGTAFESFGQNTEKLTNAIYTQQNKINLLKRKYQDFYLTQGKNSKEAKECAQEIDRLSKELKENKEALSEAEKEANKFDTSLSDVAGSAEESSNVISGAFSKIGSMVATYFAVDRIVAFGKTCVETAAEVKASNAQFQQTFSVGGKDLTKTARSILNTIAEETGIVATRLQDSGTKIYAFAKSSGSDSAQALDLMQTALTAAADAAAYYDISLEDATESLQSFLKGNFANDAALGVSCTETTRNAAAMELFGQKYQDLTEIQKQQTLLKMVTDAQELSGAMGQASREADGFENVVGNLKETWRQFLAGVGDPLLSRLIPIIQDLTTNFDSYLGVVEDVAIALGTTLAGVAIVKAINAFGQLKTAAELAFAAMGAGSIAGPVAIGAVTVGALGLAFHHASEYVKEFDEQSQVSATTYEEAVAGMEKAKAAIDALNDSYSGDNAGTEWSKSDDYAYSLAQAQYNNFKKIIETGAYTMAEAAEATEQPVSRLQEITNNYTDSVTKLMDNAVSVYNQISQNIDGWFSPFQKVAKQAKVSLKDMTDGMLSQIDYFTTYNQNIQTLTEAGLGSFANQLQSMGADGAAYAQAIVDAMDKAGGATSEGGQQIVQNLTGLQSQLEESRDGLTLSMTEGITDLGNKLTELGEQFNSEVGEWDKSGEAGAAAAATMSAFRDALAEGGDTAVQAMSDLGSKLTSALQAAIGTITMTVNVVAGGGGGSGGGGDRGGSGSNPAMVAFGHKDGLDYVPYDEYPARLHKGEAVLTAAEARAWRAGKRSGAADAAPLQHGGSRSSSGVTIVQNIQAVPQTPAEIAAATAAYWEIARWAT